MSEWPTTRLNDLCERVTVGYVGAMADQYVASGVPFLRSLNIRPYRLSFDKLMFIDEAFDHRIKKSALRPGDVAIVRTGYPGVACVIPESLPHSNCSDLVIVRPGRDLNPHFLCAIFNSTFGRDVVAGNLVGAAQQHFNITVAKELKFSVPKKPVQDKIAAALVAYDDLIENNRRRIALLERMAEQLYREWFVRFRFPGYQQAKFEKALPADWAVTKLGDLYKTASGGTPSRASQINYGGSVNWLKTGELKSIFVLNTEETISNQGLESSSAKIFPRLTVVMAMYCAMPDISILAVDSATNQACCALLPKKNYLSPSFTFYLAKYALAQMVTFAHGAAQQNLSQDIIKNFKVLLPEKSLVERFTCIAAPIFEQIEMLLKANLQLTKTRDLLLPRLISGKLRVDDLDIQFPPSMQTERA